MIVKKWWSDLTKPSVIVDFCIDYPSEKHGTLYEGADCVIQGWVVVKPELYTKKNAKPYLSMKLNENLIRRIELDRARPDVIKAVFSAKAAANKEQLYCGFRFLLPLAGVEIQLKLHLTGQVYELTKISLPALAPVRLSALTTKKSLKVLKGTDDWLFLDNDTNFSVDQHRGHLVLSEHSLLQWQKYIDNWQETLQPLGDRALFLIAPTKESVLGKYHPYPEALEPLFGPVFQKMSSAMYLHPAEALSLAGDETFYKTDTHWTHQGAQVTTSLVAQRLGLDTNKVEAIFAKDVYKTKAHAGDLGNKMNPPCAQPAAFLVGFSYRPWVIYDNALQNFGRIVVIEYEAALKDATCLIFGSSSSYSMFSYLCRLFKRIVFVHTAGNIDKALMSKVAADYFIAQTNARFMIRPPHFDYNVMAIIKDKQKNLTADQQQVKNKNTVFKKDKNLVLQQLGLSEYMAG